MEAKILEKLRACALFADIDGKVLEDITADSKSRLKTHPGGALIAQRGDAITELHLLLEGRLSAEIIDWKGKTVKIETLQAPCHIAGPLLFAETNRLPVQLVCECPVTLLTLPHALVIRILQQETAFLNRFLRDCGDKIAFLSEKIRMFQFSTIRQKIAGYILDQLNLADGDTIILPVSIETLSEIFSVSRPSLSRSLSEMSEEGYIRRNGKRITADPERLRTLLDGEI